MNFYQLAYLGTNENFFLGIFHGALFSFPFSVPFLISCRYFIFHQWRNAFISLLGTLSGQILFFIFVSSGARPLIQFWYTVEPFLSFIGILLIFQIGTEFYHQNLRQLTIGHSEAIESSMQSNRLSDTVARAFASQQAEQSGAQASGTSQRTILERLFNLKIFFFQFFLIFCNPVFPALSTRILFNQDIFTQIGGFAAMYVTGFSIAGILSSITIIYLISFLISCVRQVAVLGAKLTEIEFGVWSSWLRERVFAKLLASGDGTGFASQLAGSTTSQVKLAKPRTGEAGYIKQPASPVLVKYEFFGPRGVNNFFVCCLLGLGLHGSLQYTWRFLTYYPLEFAPLGSIGGSGGKATSGMNIIASETNQAKILSLENDERIAKKYISASRSDAVNPALLEPAKPVREGSTDSLGFTGFASQQAGNSPGNPPPYKQGVLTRQFGTQDSSIRHREKTLPVERHLPIERINTRRTLSGRLPLKNEQKSDAYIKYNSFVFNKFENFIENIKIQRIDNPCLRAGLPVPAAYKHAGNGEQLTHHGWIPFNMIERFNGISRRICIPADMKWVPRGIVALSTDFRNQNLVTTEQIRVATGYFGFAPVTGYTTEHPEVAIIGKEKHDTKGKPKFSYIRRLTNFLDPIFMNIGVSTIDSLPDTAGYEVTGEARQQGPGTGFASCEANQQANQLAGSVALQTVGRAFVEQSGAQTSYSTGFAGSIKSIPQAVLGTPNQQEMAFHGETGYLHDDFLVEFALLNFLD